MLAHESRQVPSWLIFDVGIMRMLEGTKKKLMWTGITAAAAFGSAYAATSLGVGPCGPSSPLAGFLLLAAPALLLVAAVMLIVAFVSHARSASKSKGEAKNE